MRAWWTGICFATVLAVSFPAAQAEPFYDPYSDNCATLVGINRMITNLGAAGDASFGGTCTRRFHIGRVHGSDIEARDFYSWPQLKYQCDTTTTPSDN